MSAKEKFIIGFMLLLLVLIVAGESSKQKINWRPSFAVKHKIPYGTYIAYNEAKNLWNKQFHDVIYSPYVFLQKNPEAEGTYLLYNHQLSLGTSNLEALLDWVSKGNSLFISSQNFDKKLLDTLLIGTNIYVNTDFKKELRLKLTNPVFTDSLARIDKFFKGKIFVRGDSLRETKARVLGNFVDKEDENLNNFIAVKFGKGKIYLHSFPYVFTNYFILHSDNNLKYFEGILSYLNQKKPVYWDVRSQTGAAGKGIFKYIIANPAFLWAYRLLFAGLFLYIIFEGKRKQRPIPVLKPPRNETLEFTKTIADMYINHKEYRQIALMHIKHFMDYVRNQLHIDTRKWDKKLMQKIAQKTKTDINEVENLFSLINHINQSENIKPDMLMKIEKMIQRIKKQ